MIGRPELIGKAREYAGTPFRDKLRVKHFGVDCVGVVLCTCEELGLCDIHGVPLLRTDHPFYPAQPLDDRMLHIAQERLIQKRVGAEPEPGDVFVMRMPKHATHIGFITEISRGRLGILHGYNGGQTDTWRHSKPTRVHETVLDARWRRRIVALFTIPGVED